MPRISVPLNNAPDLRAYPKTCFYCGGLQSRGAVFSGKNVLNVASGYAAPPQRAGSLGTPAGRFSPAALPPGFSLPLVTNRVLG